MIIMQNQKTFPSCTKDLHDHTILVSSETDSCTLIFLPGFDETSETHKQLFILPQSPSFNNVRTIILEPPLKEITFLGGEMKNNWFDIKQKHQNYSKGTQAQVFNLGDIESQLKRIQQSVDKEVEYWKERTGEIDYSRIFLAGFAHGGIMSLAYGLSCKEPIGGVGCFSGCLLSTPEEKESNVGATNVLLIHGSNDSLFKAAIAEQSYQKLIGREKVEWRVIEGLEHRFARAEVGFLHDWIKRVRSRGG